MRAIFISYRRDDTEGHAGRLFEDLCERFGKDAVFMDVAGIEPGRDFRRAIEQQLASCGVLLAVIGRNWLAVADAQGRRRLDDPYDFVRLETAGALKRDIPVIPVLVHGAEMPRPEQLPDELKDLAFRNGVELTHARWASDVQLLIAALLPHVDVAPAPAAAPLASAPSDVAASRRHPAWVTAPLAALAAGGIAYVAWDRLSTPGQEPTTVAASAPAAKPAASVAAAPPAPASQPALPPAAPAIVAATSAPETASEKAASSPAAAARRVDKPVLARPAAPAPKPQPARTAALAPAPAAAPRAAIAPAPDAPSGTVERPATAAPAPEPPVRAPAEAPAPEIAAAPRDAALDLLGSPGAASMVTRTIVIRPDTKYVNVTGGEVVRFEVGTKSFVWNFSGQRSSFDLARVAPLAMLDRKVTAYVAPNPMYPRRR